MHTPRILMATALLLVFGLVIVLAFLLALGGPEELRQGDFKSILPPPDSELGAAQLLELPPEDCAGVDDALAGVESARTAGMTAAAIGPAALAGAGDWNLECLSRLLDLCPPLEGGRDL